MSVIAIASIVTVLGAALGLILTHRLVGFRAGGSNVSAARAQARSPQLVPGKTSGLNAQIRQLQSEIAKMNEQLRDRELMDEHRWRQLDEVQTEVRELRKAAFELELGLDDRLRRLGESREQRERDRERFGRYRERELDESAWHEQIEPEPVGPTR